MPKARIGLDIGGTFTDVVLETGVERFTAKVLTTPAEPEIGAMLVLDVILAQSGIKPGDVVEMIHGTTLATNALIERKGAKTALLTTLGFRDVIEIGTEGRPDQYDVQLIKPEPLVPRMLRFEVSERLDASGNELIAIDRSQVKLIAEKLRQQQVESVAIGFLHSYMNPIHEEIAAEIIRELIPDVPITLSAQVSPEFREFERFSTACANAYIQPLMEGYLTRFEVLRREKGFNCPMLLMLSGGGLTTIETAQQFPVRLVESGPAGGAIFASVVAQRCGLKEVLSFDMGGTTAKICMIDNGQVQTSRSFEVARVYRFKKGSGLPLRVPVVELVEIGAGGGSIAHLDGLQRIAVGPESASAVPGPACYGRGGLQPTVTDANLVMGRIDPVKFAGGEIMLSTEAAFKAFESVLSSQLEISDQIAAYGVSEMVDENMAGAARVHAIESGKSIPARTLVAFGGCAPLHAVRIAEKLDIARVIIPSSAGVGSAVGFLRAPISYEIVKTQYQRLGNFDFDLINNTLEKMANAASSIVHQATKALTHVERRAYMRYVGQGHEILIDIGIEIFDSSSAEMLRELFDQEYERVYGRSLSVLADVEVASWVVTVATQPTPDIIAERRGDVSSSKSSSLGKPLTRDVFDPGQKKWLPHYLYNRSDLVTGFNIQGPAVIVENETSTVISPAYDAKINAFGDIDITRR
jgi:N-methylhydantoinase A